MENQDNTIRNCLLFLCFVVGIACLYLTRGVMTPFALAVFFWLIIDAFARWIDRLSPKIPYWAALTVAILVVIFSIVGIILILANTANDVVDQAPAYEKKLTGIFDWMAGLAGQDHLDFASLDEQFGLMDALRTMAGGFANSVQGVLSNFMMITLYVAFLFAAQNSFPKKMDDLFPDPERRLQAGKVGERIRHSIETYLGVQTVISLLQTVLSYIVMVSLGLDNALFWALVVFILNYIPIVGAIGAWAVPPIFALIQFDSTGKVFVLWAALFTIQTLISNTLQPKMMGDSMNLSAIVVILSITLWGALWGGVGAFLSAPLTVIIMIILAQFKSTHWMAVLLSSDGQPDLDPEDKVKAGSIPSL